MENNVVELKNKKLRGGFPFKIYATDCGGDFPIHGAIFDGGVWRIATWTNDLKAYRDSVDSDLDIIDVNNKYEDFKIDDKVIVWNHDSNTYKRYFAGINSDGKPLAFMHGSTSWSNADSTYIEWDYCERWVDE